MAGNAADTVIDLYHENAAAWIELRGSDLMEQSWLDSFLAAMPPEGQDILDIGCGAGAPIARYLIGKSFRIMGVDGAAALIDIARARFPDQTWITADMRSLPPLARFHGLVAWHSLFHLKPADQRPMFETFSCLCLPRAALLFTSGTIYGEAIGTFAGQPLYHGSLDAAEYRHLLQTNGFEVIHYVENDPSCGGANIWLAKKISSNG